MVKGEESAIRPCYNATAEGRVGKIEQGRRTCRHVTPGKETPFVVLLKEGEHQLPGQTK